MAANSNDRAPPSSDLNRLHQPNAQSNMQRMHPDGKMPARMPMSGDGKTGPGPDNCKSCPPGG